MTQKKTARKKPFNFRLPVALALSQAAGISYGLFLAYFGLEGVLIVAPCALFAAFAAAYAFFRRRLSGVVCIALSGAFFLAGALCFIALYQRFTYSEAPLGTLCTVTGIVDSVGESATGKTYLVLSRVSAEGIRLDGKLIVYLGGKAGDYCRRGYRATFLTALYREDFFSNGGISYRAAEGIGYYGTVYGGLDAEWRFSPCGEVGDAIARALFLNLDSETASVCLALLTGNADFISEGTLASFRYGGIAHLFAVSGLHIGVVYGALTFVFKRTSVNKYVSAVLRLAFVFFYAGVCGFTPSSVRAAIMCSVGAVASLIGRKNDPFNSVSIAAIVLLFVNPLYLFGAGFVMSFGAVLGILFLRYNLVRALHRLPQKLSNLLAVGLSAQIANVPAQLCCFGYVSTAGLVMNLLVVPLVSALYVVLFFCTLIAAAIGSSAGFLVSFAAYPVELLMNFTVACGFENAIITSSVGGWIFLPFALLIFALSDKCNFRLFWRGAMISAAAIWLTVGFASLGDLIGGAVKVTVGAGYAGGSAVIGTQSGSIVVISRDYSGNLDVPDDVAAVVIVGSGEDLSAYFALETDCGYVYFSGDELPLPKLGSAEVVCSDVFTLCGVRFTFVGEVLRIDFGDVTFSMFCTQKNADPSALPEPTEINLYCFSGESGVLVFGDGNSYGLDYCGEISFSVKDGKYSILNTVPKEGAMGL